LTLGLPQKVYISLVHPTLGDISGAFQVKSGGKDKSVKNYKLSELFEK